MGILLGFSTATLYKWKIPGLSKRGINLFKKANCRAIELANLNLADVSRLKNFASDLKFFEYISIHAPNIASGYQNNQPTRLLFSKIEKFAKKIKIDCVVIHPTRIKDPSILSKYQLPFAFENMDYRCKTAKTPASLAQHLGKYKYGIVLDLQHTYGNDKTMKLAKGFAKKFKNQITEIHLSGFIPVSDHNHALLYQAKQRIIIKSIPDINIPIIIESPFDPGRPLKKQIENEMAYIKKIVSQL